MIRHSLDAYTSQEMYFQLSLKMERIKRKKKSYMQSEMPQSPSTPSKKLERSEVYSQGER